jgi:hypothetical protein
MLSFAASAQQKTKYIYAGLSDKSVSLTPFYKVFGSSFDPAITLGGGMDYIQKGNSYLFQLIEGTAYSTKLIGQGITFSTSIGYRYKMESGLYAEILLGLGTSVFSPSRETFSLDENERYERVNPIRAILGAPVDLAAGYQSGKYAFYLKYRYMIEGTYTDILPILPTSLLGCGIRYQLGRMND